MSPIKQQKSRKDHKCRKIFLKKGFLIRYTTSAKHQTFRSFSSLSRKTLESRAEDIIYPALNETCHAFTADNFHQRFQRSAQLVRVLLWTFFSPKHPATVTVISCVILRDGVFSPESYLETLQRLALFLFWCFNEFLKREKSNCVIFQVTFKVGRLNLLNRMSFVS